jgi:hypothetical protein
MWAFFIGQSCCYQVLITTRWSQSDSVLAYMFKPICFAVSSEIKREPVGKLFAFA